MGMTMMKIGDFRGIGMAAGLAALSLVLLTSSAVAQSFAIGSKEVQVHGSFQQGFVVTDNNNFLTMDTTSGSGAMTDGSINLSSSLNKKLRVGAQMYARNIGELGNGSPQLDWAFADYKFNNMVGLRAGKIKTVLGLFTDTQDTEFLYTWALLPQGTYPLDLRSIAIAHIGADVYGSIKVGKAGSLAYTGYLGKIQDDSRGGYRYGVQDAGLSFRKGIENRGGGFDVRWATPVSGLMTGYSFTQTKSSADLTVSSVVEFTAKTNPWRHQAVYADYQGPRLRVNGELRYELSGTHITPAIFPDSDTRSRSAFATVSYRLFDKLEVGTYYSRFIYDRALDSALNDNHIYDAAVTGRIDINRFWNVKVEGHFMDGTGNPTLARGFYIRDNLDGFTPKSNMLVIRTGVNF
jgi:hypothetical protein